MGLYSNDVNTLANGGDFLIKNNIFMDSAESVREYVAVKAQIEREKELMDKEIESFAQELKNGFGEEIRNELKEQSSKKENKIKTFFKRLINTCQ